MFLPILENYFKKYYSRFGFRKVSSPITSDNLDDNMSATCGFSSFYAFLTFLSKWTPGAEITMVDWELTPAGLDYYDSQIRETITSDLDYYDMLT